MTIGRRQARPWDRPFQDVDLVAEGDVLQFQRDAGAEGRPKNGEESWQDRHRKRVAPRRVNSIISSCSEFPVGTLYSTRQSSGSRLESGILPWPNRSIRWLFRNRPLAQSWIM